MIVALHAATGAATGMLTRSRLAVLAIGPLLHVAGDRVPHRHPVHPAWEYVAGIAAITILADRRGALDAVTLGAAAAVMPDLEHLVPRLRLRGEKVFHRRPEGDRSRRAGLSARSQLAVAALLLVPAIATRLRTERSRRPYGSLVAGSLFRFPVSR